MAEVIINDNNYLAFTTPPDGLSTGHVARDWDKVEYGATDFAVEVGDAIPLIPRAEWPDRIADMERTKTRLSDIADREGVPCLNQGSLPYCHAYSPALALMILRASMGLPMVMLSPGSIGGPATGYKSKGAWIGQDLKVITTLGCATTEFVPEKQVSRSGWKSGAEQNALLHRVTEWYELPRQKMFDYVMSCLFARIPVCTAHNWWGHAVTACDPVMNQRKEFGTRDRNSWGPTYGDNGWFVLMEGKGTPDEAYAPRAMTTYAR